MLCSTDLSVEFSFQNHDAGLAPPNGLVYKWKVIELTLQCIAFARFSLILA